MDKYKKEVELEQVIRFGGVFKFTNPTNEDFSVLWNNKEYTFLANTTSPIIIPNETLENIQEIRKKFAFKLAVREFYKGKDYARLSKMGNGMPPTFDEKILEPMIEKCLTPLPESMPKIKQGKTMSEKDFKGSKPISENSNLSEEFKDAPIVSKGKMPDKAR